MSPWLHRIGAVVLLSLAAATLWLYWPAKPAGTGGDLGAVLGGNEGDFARAEQMREFEFPSDHGPHPGFRSEWWYVTSHLQDGSGQTVTLMLTFFRFALRPEPASDEWSSPQLYMAHYALLDTANGRHYHGERLQRTALGLAGAQRQPYRVWLNNWSLQGTATDLFPAQLVLDTDRFRLDLQLTPMKPPVLQGEAGLSRKSAEPGNASYYYSYTRLAGEGSLRIDGQQRQLTGEAWMDREFGSSALADDQVGWDWFSLQLDNQHELMIYQMRRRDGSVDPSSHGVWVNPDGSSHALDLSDYEIEVLDHWESPDHERTYPARWRIRLRQPALSLEVEPIHPDQEMRDTRFRYYEGAVTAKGHQDGQPIHARGFVEMTGYDQP